MSANMNRAIIFLAVWTGHLHAYHKFCYITYNYPNDTNRKQLFETTMKKESPLHPRRADYTFSYHTGTSNCFVRITKKERRRIQTRLSGYNSSRLIDENLIRQIAIDYPKDREMIWILQDFRRDRNQITVQDARIRLGFH